ncbi:MAG TPA: hotdog domain-containing protein, partial [Roseimicrobium sp.]|nr:hotdog domain-containing protein [Roseimicrobium sp.]
MSYEFKAVRRVEFSETDMAGIVHYSNFFRYMEHAEHAFFRSLGFSIVTSHTDPPVGWPRVHAECDYHHPLRFEDEVEIHMLVCEKRSKSLS